MKNFIEYVDNGDMYMEQKRHEASEVIEIRLYCEHEDCNKYIIGHEGYNGKFTAETGQQADLRNESWFCKRHEPEVEVPLKEVTETIKLSRYEQAILLVVFEADPIPIHMPEIIRRINEKRLLRMSDETFKKYAKDLKASKVN